MIENASIIVDVAEVDIFSELAMWLLPSFDVDILAAPIAVRRSRREARFPIKAASDMSASDDIRPNSHHKEQEPEGEVQA